MASTKYIDRKTMSNPNISKAVPSVMAVLEQNPDKGTYAPGTP